MDKNLLSVYQLCDSNFPTGAFSHSFGLESYIQADKVHDAQTFAQWLEIYLLEQLVHADGLAVRMVYDALTDENCATIWKMDRLLTIQNMAQETREGAKQMGRYLVKIAESIYDVALLSLYKDRISQKEAFGHPAIVFTIAGHYLNISKQETILYYLYTTVVNLVQNAVRAIPLGQTAGQKIIYSFQPKLETAVNRIKQLDEIEFGAVSPGIELSQMQHERLNVRIFMS